MVNSQVLGNAIADTRVWPFLVSLDFQHAKITKLGLDRQYAPDLIAVH